METKLTDRDARQSLTLHVAVKGSEIQEKYGPNIGRDELLRILDDRSACRYPCEVVFDSGPLEPGEIAYPEPRGERPEDGFTIFVHPFFAKQPDRLPYLVLYQLVLINYGEFASPEDAEIFGASAMGLPREDYYALLCAMADQVGGCEDKGCQCHA